MEYGADGRDDLETGRNEDDSARRPTWGSLFSFTSRTHALPLLIALILSVASGVIIPALAVFLGKIFDLFTNFGAGKIGGSNLVGRVSTYGIALSGLGCASGFLNATYYGFWLTFGELQAKSAREKLFDAMLEKDMEWYDMRKSGIDTLISRLQSHIRELQLATSQPLGFAIQYTVTTIAALGLAFYYSWSLTLVTLATVPLSAIFLAWASASMQPAVEAQAEALTDASKLAGNAISAIETVKCFNGQDLEIWQYTSAVRKAARCYLAQARANALQIGFVRLVTLGMFVQGFWFGSHLVNTGKKTPGDILTAFWAALMATQSVEQILPQLIVLEKGRAAGTTLKTIMVRIERGRKVVRMTGGNKPLYCDGDIEVRNVSFAYPSRPEQIALDHVNFFFPAGETTFVVGKSGSGKSTLGNLLMRFYTPTSGQLLVDGNSIQTLDLSWLRNNITLVQQQTVLFNETIFKNISFGRSDHSTLRKEEIKRSIELAMLQHTIGDMPHGLDTVVGTGGNGMSGGQRQRVALARARLRNAPILVLDEATSALDHMTKTLVVEGIRKWRQGKTTIIITHDVSQMFEDDFAYVLEEGRVIQEGYKHLLMKTSTGPFAAPAKASFDFPLPSRRKSSLAGRRQADADEKIRSVLTETSDDSIDIGIQPRRKFIPSVFGPYENTQPRRGPYGQLLAATPAAMPRQQQSTLSSSFHRPKRRSVEHSTTADAIELANLPSWNGQVLQGRNDSVTRLDPKDLLHAKNLSSDNISSQPRRLSTASTVVEQPARCNQRLAKEEKASRIAPIQKILLTIWPTLPWQKRIILILGFVCATLHASATPLFSFVFAKLLGTFFLADRSERSHKALVWSLSVLGVAVVDAMASCLMHILLEYCGQVWVDALRIEALKRILDQPRAWFDVDENSVPRLTECLDRNAEEMRNLLGRFAGFVFVAVVMMGIALMWSLVLDWKLTLVGMASAPFLYAVTRSFEHVSGKWESKSNDASSAANAISSETFSNIRTVRALTLEGYFHNKYLRATHRTLNVGLKRSAYSGFFFGLSDSGIIFVTALIFYYGARLASSDSYATQNILTVFTMLLFSIANANAIVAFIPQINSSRATATRLLRLAHLPFHSSHEHTGHIRLSHPGPLTFTNTTFTYPSRPTSFPTLSSVNLTLHPGVTTAIIGASGSGKSTLASLLLNLYAPSSGSITINHMALHEIHTPTLRTLISLVPQTLTTATTTATTLFPTTIASNIAYALPESSSLASRQNIHAAAKAAGIHHFITTSLPHGYDTVLGPGGVGNLSGGQQQRIAIARAIVRKPRFLILDEATSALDGETAGYVKRLVTSLSAQGVGVAVICHDVGMLALCERVVVLQAGSVVEEGPTRDVLRRRGGVARRLFGVG